MFDEIMPDQIYQFLVASSTRGATPSTPLPLPLSFSLHHHHHHHNVAPFTTFHHHQPPQSPPPPPPPQTSFDSHPSQQGLIPSSSHFLHHTLLPLQIQQFSHKHENPKEETTLSVSPSRVEAINPWSNDEVLALLRIRSSMDNNWFHDFTWEDVSRKLGELGFKRSAEKCKEKFEEETRSFNNNIINTSNNNNNNVIYNYMLFSELEELCNNSTTGNETPKSSQNKDEEENVEEQDKTGQEGLGDHEKTKENTKRYLRKRKRQDKFEMVIKGLCESIVNKMMAKQEQLICKILQDMVDRDEVKIAEEEAWKKQEIERVEMDMKIRAHELAIASDRQSKILDVLNKFMSSKSKFEVQSLGEAIDNLMKVPNTSSNSLVLSQNCYISAQPTLSCTTLDQNTSCLMTQKCLNMPTTSTNENLVPQSPNRIDNSKLFLPISSPTIDQVSQNPNPLTIENNLFRLRSISTRESSGFDHTNTNTTDQITNFNSPKNKSDSKPLVGNIKDDTGRRWPRDEVLALINIRCSLFNNNNDPNHDRETSSKAPLWERISQKMMELGYKRNAKRCKEKWENINKYFRKTKDLNKKRSIDSRTCPYFHHLSHLYSQGNLLRSTGQSSEQLGSSENGSEPMLIVQEGSRTSTSNSVTTTRHGSQGNEGVVQEILSFDF